MSTAFLRFRAGEEAAFDHVVTEYTGPAYAAAVQILRDPALAEEAVQDAFVRLWQRAKQFEPGKGAERSWILAIVRNQAIDVLRKRARAMERSIDDAPSVYALRDPDDVWQSVLAGLTGEKVLQAIRELPAEQQEVVVRAYYEGKKLVEVARELNIPEGTARSRLRLALSKLRDTLSPVREALGP
ncbi:MAG TPA: sigma-70 family RNA polymerase sigma factor [Tepidiformaceae bacterium]|nr:sigma-70 family RNA polymerase sigma factor [Tepidiformaceae bacterium]HMO95293.1 sigma-70 family RNA polymerase sigma factor [Tepidiformaceae bacterium]